MYTVYELHTDELNNDFMMSIKVLFPHKIVKITVQDGDAGQSWKSLLGAMPDVGNDEDFMRAVDYGRNQEWDS